MSLHRAGKLSDWETIPETDRNVWQKIAAKTKGVVTPGNIVSWTGAAFVGAGLYKIAEGDKKVGSALVIIGRGFDLGDGKAADLTGTKSPLGEATDASIDKAEALAALLTLAITKTIDRDRAVSVGVQNLTSIALGMLVKLKDQEVHPSRSGKDGTMAQWTAISLDCIEEIAREQGAENIANAAEIASEVCYEAADGLNWHAAQQYAKETFANH
jgi:phosphatidylglycerophosphate synthase